MRMLSLKENYQIQLNSLFREYEIAVNNGDERSADSLEIRIEIFKKIVDRLEN